MTRKGLFQVTKELQFCYGHRLMDYVGKCQHPHGHNGKVAITLAASKLDARGMVFDFVDIKENLQTWIDEELDHKMILRRDDPLVPILRKLNEPVYVMEENPTAENIAKVIFEHVKSKGMKVSKIQFWETPSSHAVYMEKGE